MLPLPIQNFINSTMISVAIAVRVALFRLDLSNLRRKLRGGWVGEAARKMGGGAKVVASMNGSQRSYHVLAVAPNRFHLSSGAD